MPISSALTLTALNTPHSDAEPPYVTLPHLTVRCGVAYRTLLYIHSYYFTYILTVTLGVELAN